MKKMIKVAASGPHPVPREDNPRRYIEPGDQPVEVPESAYYLRRITDGELEVVDEAAAAGKEE